MRYFLIFISLCAIAPSIFGSEVRAYNAVFEFHEGMNSNDFSTNQKTLEKFLHSDNDLIYLLGDEGKILAEGFDRSKVFERFINDAGSLAEKIRRKGKILHLKLEQASRTNSRFEYFYDELDKIPPEVKIYVPQIKYEKISGGPFNARIIVMADKVVFIVGFEHYLEAAKERQNNLNKSLQQDASEADASE